LDDRLAETLPASHRRLELEEAEKMARATKRRANRGALPGPLPPIESMVGIESDIGLCRSGTLHRIGENAAASP
jgi:hypothetical protein